MSLLFIFLFFFFSQSCVSHILSFSNKNEVCRASMEKKITEGKQKQNYYTKRRRAEYWITPGKTRHTLGIAPTRTRSAIYVTVRRTSCISFHTFPRPFSSNSKKLEIEHFSHFFPVRFIYTYIYVCTLYMYIIISSNILDI